MTCKDTDQDVYIRMCGCVYVYIRMCGKYERVGGHGDKDIYIYIYIIYICIYIYILYTYKDKYEDMYTYKDKYEDMSGWCKTKKDCPNKDTNQDMCV